MNGDQSILRSSLRQLFGAISVIAVELTAFRLCSERTRDLERLEGDVGYSLLALTLILGLVIVVTVSHFVIGRSILALGCLLQRQNEPDSPPINAQSIPTAGGLANFDGTRGAADGCPSANLTRTNLGMRC